MENVVAFDEPRDDEKAYDIAMGSPVNPVMDVPVEDIESRPTSFDGLRNRILQNNRLNNAEDAVQEIDDLFDKDAYDTDTLEYVASNDGLDHKLSGPIQSFLAESRGMNSHRNLRMNQDFETLASFRKMKLTCCCN